MLHKKFCVAILRAASGEILGGQPRRRPGVFDSDQSTASGVPVQLAQP